MFNLPSDIQNYISDYADLSNYWKKIFTKDVLSLINKGYRLTGINTSPCKICLEKGYIDKNINCKNCFLQIPCITCWWYNILDSEFIPQCIFCDEYIFISYNNIKNYLPIKKKYETYTDFLQSDEWLDTLQELKDNKKEIINIYTFFNEYNI